MARGKTNGGVQEDINGTSPAVVENTDMRCDVNKNAAATLLAKC